MAKRKTGSRAKKRNSNKGERNRNKSQNKKRSVKKSNKFLMKAFWSVVLLLTTIIFLIAIGFFAKAFVLIEDKDTVELDYFIKDGEYRGVEVHTYVCHDEYLSDKGYNQEFSCDINGFYSGKSIYLNLQNKTNANIIKTLYHEYGHYLWYEVFSEEDRNRYNLIFISSDSFVTGYSLTGGVKEDWAETYEGYLTGSEEITNQRLSFINSMKIKYDEF